MAHLKTDDDELNDLGMNESMESNYEYRPLYRPILTESEVIAYGYCPKWKQRESSYISRK